MPVRGEVTVVPMFMSYEFTSAHSTLAGKA